MCIRDRANTSATEQADQDKADHNPAVKAQNSKPHREFQTALNPDFNFETYIEGKSNQFGRAAALQIGENPGSSYNPLFIYGGVGLGKTHLMQAVGNLMVERGARKVQYLHSEKFVREMVQSLRNGTQDQFKKHYRSLDALLVDDIQFFANKVQTQEEFFHTFNALLENCLLYTSPSPRDRTRSRMPSSA